MESSASGKPNHMAKKTAFVEEYGDFQTPPELAGQACKLLADRGMNPASVLEPTCGIGNFLLAAVEQFPNLATALGIDINEAYVAVTKDKLSRRSAAGKVTVLHDSFFEVDWPNDASRPGRANSGGRKPALGDEFRSRCPGKLQPSRQIEFSESQRPGSHDREKQFRYIRMYADEITRRAVGTACGVSDALQNSSGAKSARARLEERDHLVGCRDSSDRRCWPPSVRRSMPVCWSVSCREQATTGIVGCIANGGMTDRQRQSATTITSLLPMSSAYERWKHLGGEEVYKWRSGVKHDCSKVMELWQDGNQLRNGFDEAVDLEDDYIFPMLKSSEITNGHSKEPTRWMLVTQRAVGAETSVISVVAPKTWDYLTKYGELLDRRASSIYRNRARFSVFGVGDYTFSPWKVCISGFYKQIRFATVGPFQGKPVVLDDTSYFVSCQSEQEARCIADLLNSRASP